MDSHSERRTCRIPLRSRNNFHGRISSVLPHSSGVQDSARQQTQLVEHSMAWQCSPVGPWSWLLKEVVALDKNHCRAGCQSSSLQLTYSLNRAPHSPSTMTKSTSSLRVHSMQSSLTSLTPKESSKASLSAFHHFFFMRNFLEQNSSGAH